MTDNYAGEVMRHLSRQRRPRASAPGIAVVRFIVEADGSVETIEILQSSGSGRFDRDALRMVQRAAPYPVPPNTTPRSFDIEVTGD